MVWPFQKKVTINLSGDSAASCLEKWKHVTGTQTFFRSIMCGNPKLEKLGRKWRLIIKEHEGSYQMMKILWNQVIVMVTQLNKFTKMRCSVQSLSHVQLFATYELQHARPPTPSPTPRVYPNSCPSNRWCHPTISSSVIPFSSCPQSSPASGSFVMSQVFASGGQSIGVSASTSLLPMNTQDWSPLEWTGWISLQSKGLSRVFSNTTV